MVALGGQIGVKLPGLSLPVRRLSTGFMLQEMDWRDHPAHTEQWADSESAKYGGRNSIYWQQNYERVLIRGGTPVWPMLSRQVHIRTFTAKERLDGEWSLFRSLDHGIRHPTCCAWVAVNKSGDMVVYRQYYRTDATISLLAKDILELTDHDENVTATVADPSIWKRDAQTMEVWADVFSDNGLPLLQADNGARGYEALSAGFVSTLARWAIFKNDIDILRNAFASPTLTSGDAARLAAEPAIWFTSDCASVPRSIYEECANFRWKPQTGDPATKAAPELYQDVNDEGPDVVRYARQTKVVAWGPPVVDKGPQGMLQRILDRDKSAAQRF
jgi:hypothetical protein